MTQEPGVGALYAVAHGRVQGVGFRDFIARRAALLQIGGYVRNLPDGRSVEVYAEGSRAALERLLVHLREGPGAAHVQRVDAEWRAPLGSYSGFSID